MVKIRLSRGGAKGRPFYHIVVTDQRNARDGRNIERVGFYNPIASGKDSAPAARHRDACNAWVAKGAQLTDKVRGAGEGSRQAGQGRLSPSNVQPADATVRMVRHAIVGDLGVFGVRGWVKLESYDRTAHADLHLPPWRLVGVGVDGGDHRSARAAAQGKGMVAKLPGIDDRDAAAELVGARHPCRRVGRCRSPSAASITGSIWKALSVVTTEGVELGRVSHLFATGANDVAGGARR